MSAPMTPADCDLRKFPSMMLDVVRLRDSDFAMTASAEAFRAALFLWGAAFHQVPAASLPDDDRVLAQLSGFGRNVKEWKAVREEALRGFVLCDDGRLYHPVVAEKAMEVWEKHQRLSDRGKGGAAKRWASPDDGQANASANTQANGARNALANGASNATANAKPMRKEQNRKEDKISVSDETVSDLPSVRKADVDAIWATTPRKGRERSSWKDVQRALGAAIRRGHDPGDIRRGVAAYYETDQATKDGGDFAKGCHRLIENDRWLEFAEQSDDGYEGEGITRPSERQQRFWAEDWRDKPYQWKAYERGPPPGQPGCRIRPEILAEFGIAERAA